jgi:hypothetical protein
MEFMKINLSQLETYIYQDASNIEMNILGNFLACDVNCLLQTINGFKDWILDDSQGYGTSSNITYLEKDGEYIFLGDLLSEEKNPTEVKLSRKQLIQLLDDWRDKVCKKMPQYVMIKHENGKYTIETSETSFD